jgi:hypothetical protein
MKKELGEAPLPIGGWLILAAVQLMVILDGPIVTLTNDLFLMIKYGFGDFFASAADVPLALFFALLLLITLPLSIICAVQFFQRKKRLPPLFTALASMDLLYRVTLYIYNCIQRGFYYFDFRTVFMIALDIALIIYMQKSERVKRTFVFGRGEMPHMEDAPPLQIYGWLIIIALDVAVRLFKQFSGTVRVVGGLIYTVSTPYSFLDVLFYVATFALAIYTVLLFYMRKKLFIKAYLLLLAVLLLPYLYALIDTGGDFDILSTGYTIAYAVAATVYLLRSRRVKDTFVFAGRGVKAIVPGAAEEFIFAEEPVKAEYTDELQERLDRAIADCKAQPVGGGYVDIVTAGEYILPFVEAVKALGIRIRAVGWWRHEKEPDKTEGVRSRYFEGVFCELPAVPLKKFAKDAGFDAVIRYVREEFPKSKDYTDGLVPGFWLEVPEGWKYNLLSNV